MQRVSVRTLVLMVLLLGFVLAHQNIDRAATAGPCVVWVLTEDPNDPNEPAPIPENIDWTQVVRSWTSDPNDPNDPNGPE